MLNSSMDITLLTIGIFAIVMGLLFLMDIKLAGQSTHTWLGQKVWPVKLRRRLAISILVCGIMMTVINLLAGMGLIKL